MRKRTLLLLCSVAPAGALAACFGSNTSGGNTAAFDSGLSGDVSFGGDSTLQDTGAPDARSDVGSGGDAGDASDAPLDAPIDAPPTGMFSTKPVDFGLVNCGSAPAQSQTYSFTNSGLVPITYSASVGTSALFAVQGTSSGTVAAGGMASITLTAATVPATSTAGAALTGTLTLTTDVPNHMLVAVPLTMTPQGGSITLSPSTVGFNTAQLSVQAPAIPLVISNAGNAPVGITLGTPSDPQFVIAYTGSPGAVTLAAGANVPGATATFTPTKAGLQSAMSAIQTTGVLCASPATSIALSGTGTTEPVTAGPSPLDFGLVECGTQSTQVLPVTITNGYSFQVNYTTTLGTTFYTLDAPTGTVPAAGSAIINVTPQPIPQSSQVTPGGFNDALTINTTAPGNPSSTIALQETAEGAILGLTMASDAFGPVQGGSTGTLPFSIGNTGNLDAPITFTTTGAAFGAQFTGTSTATAGGGTAPGNATFTPTAAGPVTGTLSFGTTAAYCGSLPPTQTLTGTGVGPIATLSTNGPLALTVTCGGGTAPVDAPLTITNNTAFTLTVAASSKNGLFTVPANTTINANSAATLTLTPVAVATGSGVAGTVDGADVLILQTNEIGVQTHDIAVNLTTSGANLTFTTGTSYNFAACTTPQTFTVKNSGNATVTVVDPANGNVAFGSYSSVAFVSTVTLAQGASANNTAEVGTNCSGSQMFEFTTMNGPVCENDLDMDVTWSFSCPSGTCC